MTSTQITRTDAVERQGPTLHKPTVIAGLGALTMMIGTFLPFVTSRVDGFGPTVDDLLRVAAPEIYWSTRLVAALAALAAWHVHRRIESGTVTVWKARRGWTAVTVGSIGVGCGLGLMSLIVAADAQLYGLADLDPGSGLLLSTAGAAAVLVAPFFKPTLPTPTGEATFVAQPVRNDGQGLPPAGYYPDPNRLAPYRWWDGTAWTPWTAQTTSTPAPPLVTQPGVAVNGPAAASTTIASARSTANGFRLDIAMLVSFGVAVVCAIAALFLADGLEDALNEAAVSTTEGGFLEPLEDIFGRPQVPASFDRVSTRFDLVSGVSGFAMIASAAGAVFALIILHRQVTAWLIRGVQCVPSGWLVAAWLVPLANVIAIPWTLIHLEQRALALRGRPTRFSIVGLGSVVWAISIVVWGWAISIWDDFDTAVLAGDRLGLASAPGVFQVSAAATLIGIPALAVAVMGLLSLLDEPDSHPTAEVS